MPKFCKLKHIATGLYYQSRKVYYTNGRHKTNLGKNGRIYESRQKAELAMNYIKEYGYYDNLGCHLRIKYTLDDFVLEEFAISTKKEES